MVSFIDGSNSNATFCIDYSFIQIQFLNEFRLLFLAVLLYRSCIDSFVILSIIKLKVINNVVYHMVPLGFSCALENNRTLVALYSQITLVHR